jgi:glycosyltransferase involved in cell wall biosynthesis
MLKVTVGIKALNEERHIENAIKSALDAVRPFEGEVVLADSGSTDETIAIAMRYDIRIVQLANPSMRSCGAGAQLAFQTASGAYFYLMDGDMILDPGFLEKGISFLEANPEFAAVGGLVVEKNTSSEEFQIRASSVALKSNWKAGEVDRLDCGGLYRAGAIRDIGYFADSNLHAFEEFELGARLQSNGWKLARINAHAVDHFGHTLNGYKLLRRRMRSGYSNAPGEVLKGALGRPHLPIVLKRLSHVRNGATIIAWWALLLVLAGLSVLTSAIWLFALVMAMLLPLAYLMVRRGSVTLGLYSFAAWNVSATGLIAGFFRPRRKPEQPLPLLQLK